MGLETEDQWNCTTTGDVELGFELAGIEPNRRARADGRRRERQASKYGWPKAGQLPTEMLQFAKTKSG
jgi:hypothetical protein